MNENQFSAQLVGFFLYGLDSKNRLAIPAKFRQHFRQSKELILAQGLEGCLTLYSNNSWYELNSNLDTLFLKNKIDQRAFKRLLFASASVVRFDEDGRILIPQILVSYAQIVKEVAIVGLGNKVEIWAKQKWNQYQKNKKNIFTQHAHHLEI